MRTRVKICGITRKDDAAAAVKWGADAIGLVFYPPSPRAVGIDQARVIVQGLPPFVSVVALFVDASQDEIERVLGALPIDILQFHGSEIPQACTRYHRPYLKAIRMRDNLDLGAVGNTYATASGLLLDTYQPGSPGGTGKVFDWEAIPPDLRGRIVLAGGLNPANVETAVRQIGPYAVDVSGGVEKAKGIKDEAKMAEFVRGVKRGDDSRNNLYKSAR